MMADDSSRYCNVCGGRCDYRGHEMACGRGACPGRIPCNDSCEGQCLAVRIEWLEGHLRAIADTSLETDTAHRARVALGAQPVSD